MSLYQICLTILNALLIGAIIYYAFATFKYSKELSKTRKALQELVGDHKGDYELTIRCKKKDDSKEKKYEEVFK